MVDSVFYGQTDCVFLLEYVGGNVLMMLCRSIWVWDCVSFSLIVCTETMSDARA